MVWDVQFKSFKSTMCNFRVRGVQSHKLPMFNCYNYVGVCQFESCVNVVLNLQC